MGIDRLASVNNFAPGDESWVEVQKKAFTRWANSYLSERDMGIVDLYDDLKDGLRLIALLELLTEESKFNQLPRFRIHKLENLNLVFEFLAKNNVMLTNIGSSDILDGNNKLVLGLMWTIIKRYQVADIAVDGVSGKEGLLLWCNRTLAAYDMRVANFSSHWRNGLAFCYLLHAHAPHLLDVATLDLSPEGALANLNLAFSLFETHYEIPALLSPEDFQGTIDDKSVVTYISMVFQELTGSNHHIQTALQPITVTSALLVAIETYQPPPTAPSRLYPTQSSQRTTVSLSLVTPLLVLLYPSAFKVRHLSTKK